VSAGEWITASGEWVNDRTHGQRFRARFLRTSPPTSADGIEKYLSSGMIHGIGPVHAKKLTLGPITGANRGLGSTIPFPFYLGIV
jgi:exodeoxyribonuclease V alpha subunit